MKRRCIKSNSKTIPRAKPRRARYKLNPKKSRTSKVCSVGTSTTKPIKYPYLDDNDGGTK